MNEPVQQRPPVVLSRLLLLLFWSLLAFYLVAGAVITLNQRWFIYVPPTYTAWSMDRMAAEARLERWTNSAGRPIGMKRRSPSPVRGSVLILYGNGSCAVNSAHYADEIQRLGTFDVFILEYPGYADRPGSPNEESFFRAADEALQLLGTNRPVYLVGESLGSGVAAYLAGTQPDRVAGLMLLSPYNRLTSVAQAHMPMYPVWLILVDRFPSQDYLRTYHGPVGIMLDGRDKIVPEKFGRLLYDSYAGPKRLWSFPEGHHISIMEPPEKFWGEVLNFWKTSPPAVSN